MAVVADSNASTTSKRRFSLFKRKSKDKNATPKKPSRKASIPNPAASGQPYNKVFPSEIAPPVIQESSTRSPNDQKKKNTNEQDDKALMKKSFLARTAFFQNMAKSAFELVDQDGSGEVDEKELYSGLLMIHLKLGTYAGPAACKPITREKCQSVFKKMDKDGSGSLDKQEFEDVMMVLFGNVLFRVACQYALTLALVPFTARTILNVLTGIVSFLVTTVQRLDEHSSLADTVEKFIERMGALFYSILIAYTPGILQTIGSKLAHIIEQVPPSVWATIPLTLISTILGMMAIPWTLMKVDDFFQELADKKAKQEEEEKKKKQQQLGASAAASKKKV